MKKIVLLIVFFYSSLLYANPSPFGLEINKATVKEAKEKYTLEQLEGTNLYSDGPMYFVDENQLNIDGLKSVLLIFSKDEKLIAVKSIFKDYKFKSLNENLSKKYQIVEKKLNFVGNQYVKYQNDETIIELDSQHMSFELSLTYIDKEFYKLISKSLEQEKKQKNQKELDSL